MISQPSLPRATPVLIVGGGPVGLVASALLAERGVANVVVECRPAAQSAPAAHVLRHRTMEILTRIGIAEEIRRTAPPLALDYITWCTTFGGRDIGRIALREGLPQGADPWSNCPQNVLEPILRERVRRACGAQLVTGAECVGLEQQADGVRALVRTRDGREHRIDARWVVAADGAGSPMRRLLDIAMEGPGPQGRFFMLHVEADLRPWLSGREGPLYWILNPESPGTLIVHDPARSHVFMTLRRGEAGEEASLPGRLSAALAVPVESRILSVDTWSPHVQVAERYRAGRVFLAGDAAHRFPPTGGLGLNTGIHEVDFLADRLARVEADGAAPEMLDDYEAVCRPVAQENADSSYANMLRLAEISQALGPFATLEALEKRIGSLAGSEARRLAEAIEHQRSHFLSDGRVPPDPRTGGPRP